MHGTSKRTFGSLTKRRMFPTRTYLNESRGMPLLTCSTQIEMGQPSQPAPVSPTRMLPWRRPRKRGAFAAATVLFGVGLFLLLTWPRRVPAVPACIDAAVTVRKSEAVVELTCGGQLRGRFNATFGKNPVGPKLREGDERTPEGPYVISSRVVTPRFHRFLGVSYPNSADLQRAKQLGITHPGGVIGIHGTKSNLATVARAWLRLGKTLGLMQLWGPTDGCIGVTNEDVEVLYSLVPVGTPVIIAPERPPPRRAPFERRL